MLEVACLFLGIQIGSLLGVFAARSWGLPPNGVLAQFVVAAMAGSVAVLIVAALR